MIKWILYISLALAFSIVFDRDRGGALPATLEGVPPAVETQPAKGSRTSEAPADLAQFGLPIARELVFEVGPSGIEPGADDAGRGLHIRTGRGAAVRSIFAGRVIQVSHLTSAGLAVDVLDDANERLARYGHLLRFAPGIVAGATLDRGQTLGWVGDTGSVEPGRYALHLTLRDVSSSGNWWSGPIHDIQGLYALRQVQSFGPDNSAPAPGTAPPPPGAELVAGDSDSDLVEIEVGPNSLATEAREIDLSRTSEPGEGVRPPSP